MITKYLLVSKTIYTIFCLLFALNFVRCQTIGARDQQDKWNRRVIAPSQSNCELKEQMAQLNHRVDDLASLDEDLRHRLESLDRKLDEYEKKTIGRLDSLAFQQMDMLANVDAIKDVEQSIQRDMKESKELLARAPRQVADKSSTNIDDSQKLNALSVIITSASYAIKELQQELQANISKLAQVTNNLHRRLTNLQRRRHNGNNNNQLSAQPNFYAVASSEEDLVKSCAQGATTSDGILKLQLTQSSTPFYVRCEDKYMGGGWTIIQNRYNGNINFNRGWLEYKAGFGNLADEFFIGLEKLHAMTASGVHELLIALEDYGGEQRHAKYSQFAIAGEDDTYAMQLLGQYSGNAGDSFSYHAGNKFSTFDYDNDGCPDCNCAQSHFGGWWYNWCDMSNLNGKYFTKNYNETPTYQGVYWHTFHGANYSLRAVRMMIRPVGAEQEYRR